MNSHTNGSNKVASLTFDFAWETLGKKKLSNVDLRLVIDTLRAIPWTKESIRFVKSNRINELLRRLRSTSISQMEYSSLAQTLTDPIGVDCLEKGTWTLWEELTLKYNLNKPMGTVDIRATIRSMTQGVIKTPLDLAAISKLQAIALDRSILAHGTVTLLWQCAKCQFEYPTGGVTKRFHSDPQTLPDMISRIKGKQLDQTGTARQLEELKTTMGLPKDFDKLTPGCQVKRLKAAQIDRNQLARYLSLGAELNLLRTIKGSLSQVCSGVASYKNTCDLLGRPSFPPTADTVQLWSATFRPGKTFQNYLAHLKKACALMNHPTDWLTQTVREVSNGLINAQDLSFKFPNFIKSGLLIDLLTYLKMDSVMGQACFLSYLFALRTPSETLRLVRAFADDRLTEFVPQEDKALIGTRTYKETTVLVIKFSFRKNIRNGCILMRPCLCDEECVTANALCPVHMVWPVIRDRVAAGDPLFPTLTTNSFNRHLKSTMTAMAVPEGGLFSSHAFRRGATQEIKDSGSTFATILKTGTWRSACYKNYLDLQADEAINISTLLLENLGSDSDDSDHDPKERRMKRKVTKRVRKIPITFTNEVNEQGEERADSPT